MKFYRHLLIFAAICLLAGCSGAKQAQVIQQGEKAYREQDYSEALTRMEQVIRDQESRGRKAEGRVYATAGKAAWNTEQYVQSLTYLEEAQQLDYADEEMYLFLAENYLRIDNLSKEIDALKTYLQEYPGGAKADVARVRLFSTCLESENYEMADTLWTAMEDSSKAKVANLETYLLIHETRGNTGECDNTAKLIRQLDRNNETALRYLAEKYFWKAENRYQAEMSAYEKKRTHSQYAKLLEAFKTVNADFKTALGYFKTLYKHYPDPGYAEYLGNIYTRMDDKDTARYYYDKAEK